MSSTFLDDLLRFSLGLAPMSAFQATGDNIWAYTSNSVWIPWEFCADCTDCQLSLTRFKVLLIHTMFIADVDTKVLLDEKE